MYLIHPPTLYGFEHSEPRLVAADTHDDRAKGGRGACVVFPGLARIGGIKTVGVHMLHKLFAAVLWLGSFWSTKAAPVPLKTIKTISQYSPANACGFWAVGNAATVSKLMSRIKPEELQKEQAPLAADTQLWAKQYIPAYTHQLASDEIEALAKKAGIFCLVLGKYPNGQIAPLIWNGSGDSTAFEKMAAKCQKIFKNPEASFALPCICNVGGHWVMLALVKGEGQQPFFIFMDNCNGSDTRVQPFVSYLKKLLSL